MRDMFVPEHALCSLVSILAPLLRATVVTAVHELLERVSFRSWTSRLQCSDRSERVRWLTCGTVLRSILVCPYPLEAMNA